MKTARLQIQAFAEGISESFAELKEANLELWGAYSDRINRVALALADKDQETGNPHRLEKPILCRN